MSKKLAVYIHWPFCISKCPYCDFFSISKCSAEKNYHSRIFKEVEDRLLNDLSNSLLEKYSISSIFFGGGTPSLMTAKNIQNIINYLIKNHTIDNEIEISLEANPGTFDKQKLKEFKSAGINRLSLGIQSFSDKNLKFLGRIYDSDKALRSVDITANIFDNFSIDLIYGYACQDMYSLENDLKYAVDTGCKHLSCYQLTFEKNTPFYEKLISGDIKKISEKQEVNMYKFINEFLEMNEFYRYEISNYSQNGYTSKHNLSYWNYNDYIGIGPGAHSRITENGKKYEIIRINNIDAWINKKDSYIQKKELNQIEMLQEIILSGLRLSDGLLIENIYKKIPQSIFSKIITENKLKTLYDNKLIYKFNKRIKLTKAGFLKLDSMIEFLVN